MREKAQNIRFQSKPGRYFLESKRAFLGPFFNPRNTLKLCSLLRQRDSQSLSTEVETEVNSEKITLPHLFLYTSLACTEASKKTLLQRIRTTSTLRTVRARRSRQSHECKRALVPFQERVLRHQPSKRQSLNFNTSSRRISAWSY